MKLCLLWNLRQPSAWHPRLQRHVLPWMRVQALRSYAPLLRLAQQPGAFPVSFAISPALLEFLDFASVEGQRDTLLDLHRKPVAELRPAETEDLLGFAFEAASEALAAPFPRYAAYFQRWKAMRGNLRRLQESLGAEELQDLQGLCQLAWLAADTEVQALPAFARATAGDLLSHEDALDLGGLQWKSQREFLANLQEASRTGAVEYLGASLHDAVLPLLAGAVEGFAYTEDARAQMVRGPRVHYRHFGSWPPVMHFAEGAYSDECAALMAQSCLDWGVASSHVLDRSLGRKASPAERSSMWTHRGRKLRFSDAAIGGQFRFVYPALAPQAAFEDFCSRLRIIAQEVPDEDAVLIVEIDPACGASASAATAQQLWQLLLQEIPAATGLQGARLNESFRSKTPYALTAVTAATSRNRGLARWLPGAHSQFWELLLHARRQFQNVRAWKTLSPEALATARESLLALEGGHWVDCMEAGLDPWTRRRTAELLHAHLEHVYRTLEVERPPRHGQNLFPCETKITSIGPSRSISPRMDGKRSSYNSWSGSGFFRAREEGVGGGDSWRQISEIYFGADGVYVYLRAALPLPAAEMLEHFELQGVLHAASGEQTVTWFQIRRQQGRTALTTRLAVAAAVRPEEVPLAVVDEVVDLRIPLSALGLRLGEVLRLQVSLWEHGNAVAAAPPLGWEEFVVRDELYHGGEQSAWDLPDSWNVPPVA